MTDDLHNRVVGAIQRRRMFRAGDRVAIGVSGGADSVALFRLLAELSGELGIRLAVLHFNHQLRGAESDADEQYVAGLAAESRADFFAGREDVAAVARDRRWNLEDAARRLRYAFFTETAGKIGAACVAVAHTADDQAETVLARIVRGTGPAGLAAIYPVKEIANDFDRDAVTADTAGTCRIVRPLLEIRRSELRGYLQQIGQSWREDASNLDTTRLRARLRHDVLPVFERDLQPAIVQHLGQLADLAREDEAFWQALVADRLAGLAAAGELRWEDDGRIGIRRAQLLRPILWPSADSKSPVSQDAHMALSRRLVRGLVEAVRGDCRRLTADHIARVLELAAARSSGRRVELPGLIVERSFEWLWFFATPENSATRKRGYLPESAADSIAFFHSIELHPSNEETLVVVPEIKRRFCLKVIDWPEGERDTTSVKGILDRDLLSAPLVLRSWQPGDAFRPQGRRSVHKLKHFLQAQRVPLRERAGWPVLASGSSLVWARGLPVAADFAPGQGTRVAVILVEERL